METSPHFFCERSPFPNWGPWQLGCEGLWRAFLGRKGTNFGYGGQPPLPIHPCDLDYDDAILDTDDDSHGEEKVEYDYDLFTTIFEASRCCPLTIASREGDLDLEGVMRVMKHTQRRGRSQYRVEDVVGEVLQGMEKSSLFRKKSGGEAMDYDTMVRLKILDGIFPA